jgi:hypothetical protein
MKAAVTNTMKAYTGSLSNYVNAEHKPNFVVTLEHVNKLRHGNGKVYLKGHAVEAAFMKKRVCNTARLSRS